MAKRATYSGFVGLVDRRKQPAGDVQIEAGKDYPDDHPAVKQRPDLFESDAPRG
ncbi:hypothetical protein [Micromonospora sp. RTGN7]|uniref:hypothetical protein n=1 Tax=Micromonospora sp. RTGN7 TaxID=3016526 RepID=UPI0029FEDA00|nr:hypothetical protein [Micromonospora sp. RTGN7]